MESSKPVGNEVSCFNTISVNAPESLYCDLETLVDDYNNLRGNVTMSIYLRALKVGVVLLEVPGGFFNANNGGSIRRLALAKELLDGTYNYIFEGRPRQVEMSTIQHLLASPVDCKYTNLSSMYPHGGIAPRELMVKWLGTPKGISDFMVFLEIISNASRYEGNPARVSVKHEVR